MDGPGADTPILVDYQSEDGSANAGSDYMAVSGSLVFKPGQREQYFKIKIIDDDVFEEDEFFYVHLSNLRLQGAKGGGLAPFKLGEPSTCKVFVLDDDHSGVFGFLEENVEVSESIGEYELVVERRTGARGRVSIPYHTEDGSAKAGKDYIDMRGTLTFENNEQR
jgi:solute carrier family 8 (sodium/calcium exchanger)